MTGQLQINQTSGNTWAPRTARLYHRQQPTQTHSRVQEFDFAELEAQIAQQRQLGNVLGSLKREFIFTDTKAVENFIANNRAVVPLLLEAVPHLRENFGSVPLTLEIIAEDGPPRSISAFVLWRGERTAARSALKHFDESWWMNNLKRAAGRVVFDYELI